MKSVMSSIFSCVFRPCGGTNAIVEDLNLDVLPHEQDQDQDQEVVYKRTPILQGGIRSVHNLNNIRPPTPPKKRSVSPSPQQINWKNTIPFVPPIKEGTVIKVYDGDTITIAASLPYDPEKILYRFSVRLNGIDSPEIKGKTAEEKEAAKISQRALEDLILNKKITLENTKTEKYGRILATIYCEETGITTSLNQWMLDNKYAVSYNGGTKTDFTQDK
jgi:endonuclease YncB( thermonuclease family)